WLEIPSVAEQIGTWSELAGRDLARLGTTGGADEITDTAVAQPLLVAAALAVAALLPGPDATAGHSVGELAAGTIAGILDPGDAIRLTAGRADGHDGDRRRQRGGCARRDRGRGRNPGERERGRTGRRGRHRGAAGRAG